MEPAKPKCSNEFLWPAEFPGALPALGTDGILPSAGEFHHRGSFRYPPIAATLVCVKSQRDVMSLLVHSINSACVIILVFFFLLLFFYLSLGIAVGHVYFFLEDVFPNQPGGGRWLKTPSIM